MAGRKPLPTHLKVLRGNPGKRPLNDREPQPRRVTPRMPDHLSPEAKKEWRRMAKRLAKLGLLTEIDGAALAAYCTAYGRWVEAERNVQKYGTVMLSPDKGWPVQSPYLSIANKAMEQMHKFLTEFGMTPSSRSRIQVEPPQEAADPFEELFGGNQRTG